MPSFILENTSHSILAWIALIVFILSYLLVILEEFIQLRKSKPLLVASSVIWIIVAMLARQQGSSEMIVKAMEHNLLEYAKLLLFIIVAITYINVLTERQVFSVLRCWLVKKGYSYRQLFWITGFLTFFISPFADNLTTALAMSSILLAVGKESSRFIKLGCINIVVAANAGGAFSPFGDITTLMVWQADVIPFAHFFKLFLPTVISFLIPACCMHVAVPKTKPHPIVERISLSPGSKTVIFLFFLTLLTTVCLEHFFHLPPVIGMMTGLGYLKLFAYYTRLKKDSKAIDIFPAIKELDWDTLLFFYGILLCIGGLATLGYLQLLSQTLYGHWHDVLGPLYQHTPGNVLIGILSALIDNIPLMFAIITMQPSMSEGQWLLLTLTAGIGGSLLSIGSAAGVALMGQAPKIYTFFSHLKWSWAIALGYFASIVCHLWLNAGFF